VRRIDAAFASRYDGGVRTLFSTKVNFAPAVMSVLAQEGAGAEVYTESELHLALLGGADPAITILNDGNKPLAYMEAGIAAGVIFNIDTLDELRAVEKLAREASRPARIFIRLRLELRRLDALPNQWSPGERIGEAVRGYKLGAHWEEALAICRRAQSSGDLDPAGLHFHLGRWGNVPSYHCLMVEELIEWMARLRDVTGWVAPEVNIGGGFVHGRPEGAGPHGADTDVAPIEAFAEEIVRTLVSELERHRLPRPRLQVEPGRYLTENAGVLLAEVGAVRRWEDRTWIHVDAHGQHLAMAESPQQWHHHAVVANRPGAAHTQVADIVGRGCGFELLAAARALPDVAPGDVVAFLDAGANGETKAANVNAAPRPASVLVSGGQADLITAREDLAAVASRFSIPARLRAEARA
jgi:diaminopimelate decarboxylase